ncbi:MAG: hypothetical protein MZV63_51890 [Marinilabiliales bacterium]|nr:hypothetical protein [Marinilabiliales bacterium]
MTPDFRLTRSAVRSLSRQYQPEVRGSDPRRRINPIARAIGTAPSAAD